MEWLYGAGQFSANATEQEQETAEFVVLETWQCQPDGYFVTSDQLIVLEKRKAACDDHVYGTVRLAGIFYDALFEIDASERRWDFGEDMEYSFVIRPDGRAAYYDFRNVEAGEKAAPKQIYSCRRS